MGRPRGQCCYTYRGHKDVTNLLVDVPIESTREKGRVEELVMVANVHHGSKQCLDLFTVQDWVGPFGELFQWLLVNL